MRLGILFSSIIALTALFSSCKDDINLAGDSVESAVIYGLLNPADSVHMIKINRAFVSNGNAIEIAKIPDSSYFANINAKVEEVVNGNITRTWTLEDTLIENKESGIFFYPTQKVFCFRTSPTLPLLANANTEYRLTVDVNNGQFTISGKTKLVSGMQIQTPTSNSNFTFASSNVPLYGYSKTMIKIAEGTAQGLNVKIKVNFDEYVGSDVTGKSFLWNVADLSPTELTSSPVTVYANGETFYEMIKANVTDNSAITKRKINTISLIVTGGSQDLQDYIAINKPSSSLAQNKPIFTNLTATNDRRVIGIFSARTSVSISKKDWAQLIPGSYTTAIDQNSFKELYQGAITGGLLFCSDNPTYGPVGGATPKPWYCN